MRSPSISANSFVNLLLLLVIITFSSCSPFREKGIAFRIKNSSENPITNVKFYTSEKLNTTSYLIIEPDKSESSFFSMKENRQDGNYILEFTRTDGEKETIPDGYYTNGNAMDRWIEFEVFNDTTFVKFGGN